MYKIYECFDLNNAPPAFTSGCGDLILGVLLLTWLLCTIRVSLITNRPGGRVSWRPAMLSNLSWVTTH